MKVLIIKISSMGDIIHTLPAVTDATEAIPDITFDWIIEKTFSEIPKWHPSINKIIPIKLRSCKYKWHKLSTWKEYYQQIKQCNSQKYDLIIDAQGLLKTSLFITNIINNNSLKHGLSYKSATEPMACFFYHKRHYIKKNIHAIERTRQLFASSLKYPLPSGSGQYNIKHIFSSQIPQHHFPPYLIFFHSTTQLRKHWPEENWYIITKYAIDSGYHIKLPFWNSNEELRVKRLQDHYNQITILTHPTLHQIAIEILQSEAIISVDTGLSHLAAALNHPNLTLYGPTNPKLIGIYGLNQIILKSKTKKMQHINPDFVWKKFQKNFRKL